MASISPIPLKVAIVSRTIFYLPFWVAQRNGYFRDEGIDLSADILNNAEDINAALKSGAVQVAISSAEAMIERAFAGGTFRIVASVAQKPPHFVIALPKFKTAADLRGARFGVLSLHEGTTFLVQDMMTALGIATRDYTIDAVGGAPTRWKLLQEGKIDAGLQPFPQSYEAEAKGFSNLGPIADYVPAYEFTVAFVENAWAAANGDTLVRFLRALRRGEQHVRGRAADVIDTAMAELDTSRPFAERAVADAERLGIMPNGLAVSEPGLRRVYETLQKHQLVPADIPFAMSKFVAPRYLDGAAA
jgi:ABC-type nitrate/sulfonate/bicarbonate transport system substrate-binding protein